MIAIVDYGAGNLRSVERALLAAGATARVTSDSDELAAANGLVLPGVGAFEPALRRLESGNLGRRIVEMARRGKPLLGICLGYQLLFESSAENGNHPGLELLAGRVIKVEGTARLPVIGWCRVHPQGWSPLLDGVDPGAYMYFVHSYTPSGARESIAHAEHAPAAAAARVNVMGTQFHPEKSGPGGLRIYANFLSVCGAG